MTKTPMIPVPDMYMAVRIENHLNEFLRGSGIDAGWEAAPPTKTYLVIKSSYHCMNDVGYYDGWQDFKIKISKLDTTQFQLQFTGVRTKYVELLRDYLEDSVYQELQKITMILNSEIQ